MRLYLNTNGFGSSVLQMLLKTSIKKNLYYEIKDRVTEETFDGVTVRHRPSKCRVYGSTSSHTKRNQLIELLHQRVQHHRDKFLSKDIYDELCTMVVKPNGKVEHADDTHDDLVFSYLWALYVFYYGEDLATRFHLIKTEIFTDDHYDETSFNLEEEYMEEIPTDSSIFKDPEDETSQIMEEQMKVFDQNKSISMEDFYARQRNEELKALEKIMQSKPGREAVADAYHIPLDFLNKQQTSGYRDITEDINDIFYDDNPGITDKDPTYVGNMGDIFNRL